MVSFCSGYPVCIACGAPTSLGMKQNCPSRRTQAARDRYERKAHRDTRPMRAVQAPGLPKKAGAYAVAVAKWVAAGSPVRREHEIAAILEICEACEHFTNQGRPQCKLCGCSVNNKPDGLRNKIAMATESCPDKPPRWESLQNSENKE